MRCVLITYPDHRRIIIHYVDSEGYTNGAFEVEDRNHIIKMGSEPDYQPLIQKDRNEETSELDPLEVVFNKQEA